MQHAIDYYEALESLGKETLDEYKGYFVYYTEYSASRYGIFRQIAAVLERMPQSEQRKYIAESKEHAKNVFGKWSKINVIDVLNYLARVAVFARIEGKQDDSMFAVVPHVNEFINILNLINRYEPTKEWCAEFKKLIDALPAKKEGKQ